MTQPTPSSDPVMSSPLIPVITIDDNDQQTKTNFVQEIILKAKKENFINPVELLRFLQKEIVVGRVLDIVELDAVNAGETNHISIDRDAILETTFSEFQYITNFMTTFQVDFMGEESYHLRGPRKEWINLMNKAMYNKYFEHGLRDLLSDEYLNVGVMMAIAVFQNGQLPTYVPEDILQNIVKNSVTNQCIKKLLEGLEIAGLGTILREFPMMLHFFRPGAQQKVNVAKLKTLIKPQFSEIGSNALLKEKEVYASFNKYLREVFAGRREVSNSKIELGTILEFVTGASEEPVLGFVIEPSIQFVLQIQASFYPSSRTCSNVLILPRGNLEKAIPSEERFFEIKKSVLV